jgi:hypothetical protein
MNKNENTKEIGKTQRDDKKNTQATGAPMNPSAAPGGDHPTAEPAAATAPGFRTTTGAIFEPFSWLPRSMRGMPQAEFVARTRDVCRGVQACLQIAHTDGMDRDNERETLLSISHLEYLFLLATQAVAMLAEEADREIELMHNRARAEVQS